MAAFEISKAGKRQNPLPAPEERLPMLDTLDYHMRELQIARDASHRNHLMPPIKPHHKSILDIGCGMGQTLIAAALPADVEGYGIDRDAGAIAAGQELCPANVHLSTGTGEVLPFGDNCFDLIVCRVALPYMEVRRALAEMRRVLKPGGEVWLVLHARSMYERRAWNSIQRGDLKDVAYCGYVGLNGLLLNSTGRQLHLKQSWESFQTSAGIRRAMARSGLLCTRIERDTFFIAEGRRVS